MVEQSSIIHMDYKDDVRMGKEVIDVEVEKAGDEEKGFVVEIAGLLPPI